MKPPSAAQALAASQYFTFGRWISATGHGRGFSLNDTQPAPFFRKTFDCGEVTTASVAVCGLGYFELYLNGKRVGDHVLDPVPTVYHVRSSYVVHDVTALLKPGKNTIGVILGNGIYNSLTEDCWNFNTADWRDCPKFALELTADGKPLLGSDRSWKFTLEGPVTFDNLRCGESYDARRELSGWLEPAYDDTAWQTPMLIASPGGILTRQEQPPCRVTQTLEAHPMPAFPHVYDAAQNLAGWARITVRGEPGARITLRYGEALLPDGMPDWEWQKELPRGPVYQTDQYTLKGGAVECWEPRFTYHGFRYITTAIEGNAEIHKVEARVVGTDFPVVGTINFGNETLNALQRMTLWSYRSNFVGIPTDCPHREKNGWTGDAQLACETGLFNFDAADAYAAWLRTFADAQRINGEFPGIAPTGSWGYNWGNGAGWDSAFLIIPYFTWLYTGDDRMIRGHYDAMVRYVEFFCSMAEAGVTDFGLSDWCPPRGGTPSDITSTGYLYLDCTLLATFARHLGKPEDAAYYTEKAAAVRTAFNRTFYRGDGLYGTGTMTALACALYHGLVEPSEKEKVFQRLVGLCEALNGKVDFGIFGAKYVPRVLAEGGRADLALRFFLCEEFPSWGNWVKEGLTTLSEAWDIKTSGSLNHIMFGDTSAWFFTYLGGFRHNPAFPGWKRLTIAPCPVIPSCTACYRGYCSDWARENGTFTIRVTVPQDGTADLILPDGTSETLPPGLYTRSCSLP